MLVYRRWVLQSLLFRDFLRDINFWGAAFFLFNCFENCDHSPPPINSRHERNFKIKMCNVLRKSDDIFSVAWHSFWGDHSPGIIGESYVRSNKWKINFHALTWIRSDSFISFKHCNLIIIKDQSYVDISLNSNNDVIWMLAELL